MQSCGDFEALGLMPWAKAKKEGKAGAQKR
jgi:hypothetical protein